MRDGGKERKKRRRERRPRREERMTVQPYWGEEVERRSEACVTWARRAKMKERAETKEWADRWARLNGLDEKKRTRNFLCTNVNYVVQKGQV
jgi:hypothetical protein